MHRALTVPDILLHIISHVESKDTLGALARTSSLVSGPALDELWHTIDSLVLLARCMPPEVWDEVVLPTYQCTSLLVSGTIERAAICRLIDFRSFCLKVQRKAIGLGPALELTQGAFGI
jgi:hypothetical protein